MQVLFELQERNAHLFSLLVAVVDCRHYFLPALSQFVGDIISTHSSDLEEGNKLDDNSEDRILRALQLVLNLAKRKGILSHMLYWNFHLNSH